MCYLLNRFDLNYKQIVTQQIEYMNFMLFEIGKNTFPTKKKKKKNNSLLFFSGLSLWYCTEIQYHTWSLLRLC